MKFILLAFIAFLSAFPNGYILKNDNKEDNGDDHANGAVAQPLLAYLVKQHSRNDSLLNNMNINDNNNSLGT